MEDWREIPGLGGHYEASSAGAIRRITTWAGNLKRTPKIMAQWPNPDGYFCVAITIKGVTRMRMVNTLVCLAFHGPKPPRKQAAHRDGVKANNRQENLRWATAKENAADKRAHGTHLEGESHGRAKLTEVQVLEIRSSSGASYRRLAKAYGVTPGQIGHIINRRTWKHV